MQFEVISLFPEMFSSVLDASLLGKAVKSGALGVQFTDLRRFGLGAHQSVDDTPYGGGAGMVLRPEPIISAIESIEDARGKARKILLTPTGNSLTQENVRRLAAEPRIMLICGRYEGFDARIRNFVDEEISIGDFVLSGGELGAMIVIDAISRHLPGVLGNAASTTEESFETGLLEYPQFTRPPAFRDLTVPEVLLSGNHERIRKWRRRESLIRTRTHRPDLFARITLSDEDRKLLDAPSESEK